MFKKHDVELVFLSGSSVAGDPYMQSFEEILAAINSIQSRVDMRKQIQRSHEYRSHKRTRHVRMIVSKDDLDNYSKFKKVIENEPLYASTCGLSKSQMVLIAKILRLNLENTTEVGAEFRF